MRNGSLWGNVVFAKEAISHSNILKDLRPEAFFSASESTCINCAFSFILATSMTNWVNIFTCLLVYTFLRYTKWKYWYLTITKMGHVPLRIEQGHKQLFHPDGISSSSGYEILYWWVLLALSSSCWDSNGDDEWMNKSQLMASLMLWQYEVGHDKVVKVSTLW